MSRRMTLSPRPQSSHGRSARRASIGALALAMTLSLSACGGEDEPEATAAQETTTGAAAGTGTDAAAGADAAAAPHDDTNSDGHHAAEPAGGIDDHEHTPGMDMSGGAEGEMKSFAELEKEAAIPASKPYNFQDVYFSQHMIEHHGQAVEMAEMLLANTKNPEMKKLATAIHGAQSPEIEMMTGWLKSWGQSTENAAHSHDPNAPSAGMMTDEDMEKLHAAKGKEFDKLFLKQMIFHHEGAVNQSNKELKNGKYGPAKKLATAIIKAQTKEIKLMKELMKKI